MIMLPSYRVMQLYREVELELKSYRNNSDFTKSKSNLIIILSKNNETSSPFNYHVTQSCDLSVSAVYRVWEREASDILAIINRSVGEGLSQHPVIITSFKHTHSGTLVTINIRPSADQQALKLCQFQAYSADQQLLIVLIRHSSTAVHTNDQYTIQRYQV